MSTCVSQYRIVINYVEWITINSDNRNQFEVPLIWCDNPGGWMLEAELLLFLISEPTPDIPEPWWGNPGEVYGIW